MSKRRKRRRIAFFNRMNEIREENPTLSLDAAKTRTSIEVKNALREADRVAPHSREEHAKVFEDTLFRRNRVTSTTTTTSTTTPTTKTTTKEQTTTSKPTISKPTTTTKTTTTKTKAAPKPKPATRAKKTTTDNTKTKKRTTTRRTKKAK